MKNDYIETMSEIVFDPMNIALLTIAAVSIWLAS